MKSNGRAVKTKRLKPRMPQEELKVWYERRRKTCYHKSKKDYVRKNKDNKKWETFEEY
jgi:hypothetical protein